MNLKISKRFERSLWVALVVVVAVAAVGLDFSPFTGVRINIMPEASAETDLGTNTGALRTSFFERGYDALWVRYDQVYVHDYGTAAPSEGAWARGCIIWNSEPSASGTVGWVCVTAGSPGTWKAFGDIAS